MSLRNHGLLGGW